MFHYDNADKFPFSTPCFVCFVFVISLVLILDNKSFAIKFSLSYFVLSFLLFCSKIQHFNFCYLTSLLYFWCSPIKNIDVQHGTCGKSLILIENQSFPIDICLCQYYSLLFQIFFFCPGHGNYIDCKVK